MAESPRILGVDTAEPNIAIGPVESDLPTLPLNVFDQQAPPRISQAAVERLSHSFDHELPAGYALLFVDCGVDLMAQFLADPTQEPVAACIDEMPTDWVLPE